MPISVAFVLASILAWAVTVAASYHIQVAGFEGLICS